MSDLISPEAYSSKAKVYEFEWNGKRGYCRPISFDDQIDLVERFGGKGEEEASAEDTLAILSFSLCDQAGNKLFTPETARQTFGEMDGVDVMALFQVVRDKIGLNVEEEEKN